MFRAIWRLRSMFYICSSMDGRINVSPRELATAMTVWLRVMPTRIWRAYENYQLARQQKRHVEDPEVERAVAEYLAGKFDQAGWEVSYSERDPGWDKTSSAGSSKEADDQHQPGPRFEP